MITFLTQPFVLLIIVGVACLLFALRSRGFRRLFPSLLWISACIYLCIFFIQFTGHGPQALYALQHPTDTLHQLLATSGLIR